MSAFGPADRSRPTPRLLLLRPRPPSSSPPASPRSEILLPASVPGRGHKRCGPRPAGRAARGQRPGGGRRCSGSSRRPRPPRYGSSPAASGPASPSRVRGPSAGRTPSSSRRPSGRSSPSSGPIAGRGARRPPSARRRRSRTPTGRPRGPKSRPGRGRFRGAAFLPHRTLDVAVPVARGGPLESVVVDVGVRVLVDVQKLEVAEVDAVGAARPGPVEEVGVEDLEGQRLQPPWLDPAVEHPGPALADPPEGGLDVRDQLLRDRVAVRPVVGRVHLIRVAQRPGPVEDEDDKPGVFRPVRDPWGAGEPRAESADVDAERIAADRVLLPAPAAQEDRRPQDHRPAVEVAQELRRELQVAGRGRGGVRRGLVRQGSVEDQADRLAPGAGSTRTVFGPL